MKEHGAVFRQSLRDFPCPVVLGKNTPSFGLYRFNKALRFVPSDDEGFTLRGDRRRLLYKGRRCSHRFTILGDTAFEYDCILEKPPDSNVISLFMEGTEHFDFFRQPDFVKDPFLKGSFAVYKKETLIGEGTGKLCHIHRPEIIDARGRRCWGDLAVIGNELRIIIPEWWLAEAKYPVVVDPVVGSQQVGSQTTGEDPPYHFFDRPVLDNNLTLSRYYVAEKAVEYCSAYIYCCWENNWNTLIPAMYTDNNELPQFRKSKEEEDIYVKVTGTDPAGWRSGGFELNGSVKAGSYIWYGVRARLFATKFDYTSGNDYCYKFYSGYNSELPSEVDPQTAIARLPMRFSWYLAYFPAPPGINYNYLLKSNAFNSDSHSLSCNYKRTTEQSSRIFDFAKPGWAFFSKIIDTVNTTGTVIRGLLIAVFIASGVYIRDYLLGRITRARSELVIKSCISREITLESKIH